MSADRVSNLRSQLSPTKRALLEKIFRGDVASLEDKRRIATSPPQPTAPLSFAQQRLWFLDQFAPGNPFYNISLALRLKGAIAQEALERALSEVVRRHEVLRSTFQLADGEPAQVVSPDYHLPLTKLDLSHLAPEERESTARELAQSEAGRPFDLARGPLLRVCLVTLGEQEWALLVTIHHIISDRWSIELLMGEMSALYKAFVVGESSPLAPLPIQYADFARWQRDYFQGELLAAQIDYWKRQLLGVSPVLRLPTDHPRPAAQNFSGATYPILLSTALGEKLRSFSKDQGVTLFTTLLTAFKVLLSRYSGETDIVVGIPVSGRDRLEIESLIGFFVNTLPLRGNLNGALTIQEALQRIRKICLGAYAHQDVPLERLVDELQVKRSPGYQPLIQVMFALETRSERSLDLPGVTWSHLGTERTGSKFDLTLTASEGAEGLSCLLEYNTDLYEARSIERMLSHYAVLLEGIVSNPEGRLGELSLLGEAERRQIVKAWNETTQDYPRDLCIHHLFEQQVSRTPESIAVVWGEQEVSYEELNRRANQLAHHLRRMGVGPEVCVGLYLERSPEMLIGILAALKAGGAYVPLDTQYPQGRLSFMLEDANVRALLTQDRIVSQLPAYQGQLVCLDSDWERIATESVENPCSRVCAENLVYIIYTSGSTGQPKGVMISHQALVNYLFWCLKFFDTSYINGSILHAPIAFDGTKTSLYFPILAGQSLVLVDESAGVEGLVNSCQRGERLSLLKITPAHLEILNRILKQEEIEGWVNALIVGGEALFGENLQFWLECDRRTRLIQEYGPTETTVSSSYYEVAECEELSGPVPIGRPIANTDMYVLDKSEQPVPIGVAGELYIGGAGLARGYNKRGGFTAERFVPHLFSNKLGERLYRTGDLVKHLPDGNIEFLGRMDHQVKIRGFRIELGEIEAALSQHELVREVLVTTHTDELNHNRLVAYLVISQPAELRIAELRRYLSARLPEYMIPSAFVQLEVMPLTPNGKVDRDALPTVEWDRAAEAGSEERLRTPNEEIIAGIWHDVLKVKRVGREDNFFELGGHSLLAIQVISRIRNAFQVEAPLRDLFDSPTVAGLAGRVEEALSGGHGINAAPIKEISREQELPLSFAQQRLWFIEQLQPGRSTYNIPLAARLKGALDYAALERMLSEIVRRHEVLRTTFSAVNGKPVQIIAPPLPVPLAIEDLSDLTGDEIEARTKRRIIEEAGRPFDLGVGPLFRVKLLRLGPDEHILLLTMHHIISDGWSMGVFIREVAALYEAYSSGKESPLAELRIQYADFAAWEQQWFRGEVLDRQLAYWKRQLSGAPPVLELATDKPRPPIQRTFGAAWTFGLSEDLTAALKELSRYEGITLFMALLSAFQSLLCRYTRQNDIIVGADIANRNRAEIEGLIGFFVNQLVLRADLQGNPTFREITRRVREVCLGAYSHQQIPFDKLVEELQPARDLSHTPLFQVKFLLQNAPAERLEVEGLSLTLEEIDNEVSQFDLTLVMEEESGKLTGKFLYNTDLFEAFTIQRMAGRLETLLKGAVINPQQRLSELPLLTDAERQQSLDEWNRTGREYQRDICIHRLFERQAARAPQAIAVERGIEQVSYEALNARANQLAHHLVGFGVGPEVVVGIVMERSVDMLVALIAVLKAGGAYLPIDPSYPMGRLQVILEDAGVSMLLTRDQFLDILPAFWGQLICLDTDWDNIAGESSDNLPERSRAENLAYIIYTSGSTGKPKGVQLRHSGLVSLASWHQRLYGVTPASRATLLQCVAFDGSVWELWPYLISGASLHVVPEECRVNVRSLAQWLTSERIDICVLPTPLAEIAFKEEWPTASELRFMLTGGDKLRGGPPESAPYTVVNHYGPTESTVVATCVEVKAGETNPPIGRPIDNTQVYLLDKCWQPVPIGVAGELYIGGEGVARGYVRRSELTAEKFIPNPYSAEPGTRLYGTGDLARYLDDGNLEYLGRIDEQVKIRGFRIELGEIEAALHELAGIGENVVMALEDGAGDKRLVAYVVPPAGGNFDPSRLRVLLKERLPEYMAPTDFVLLGHLPLTPNGKVDRNALSMTGWERVKVAEGEEKSLTSSEEIIAGIWQEVLGIKRVGLRDNFFDLGGHSLLATQVLSRVRDAFEIEVMLQLLFEFPTVADLARRIDAARQLQSKIELPPILPTSREETLPLSSAQRRLWFIDQLEPNSPLYNVPAAVHLRGLLDVAVLERAFSEIVRRHEALRTTFVEVDEHPIQVINATLPVNLPITDLTQLAESGRGEEAMRLAAEEARRPFDLTKGPLLRVGLLRLGESEWVVLLTMHHIISDAWSMGILFEEISRLYEAFSGGNSSPLPELSIQYADFAVWQRQWVDGEVMKGQLSYWKRQLAGAPSLLKLPTDRSRPEEKIHQCAPEPIILPTELSDELKALSRREGTTLFMTLLAAFQTLLSYYSGQDDIVVGTDIANRRWKETETLIGFFVNQLVLRTDLSGNPSFWQLLRRVRKVTLDAYAHQDLPFERLVEALNPDRSLSGAPLFQAKLVLQNTPGQVAGISGLTWGELEAPTHVGLAKYDLLMTLVEGKEGLKGTLEYSAGLFNASTAKRIIDHYRALLSAVVKQPDATTSDLYQILAESDKDWQAAEKRILKDASSQKFNRVRRRAFSHPSPEPVSHEDKANDDEDRI